MLQLGRFCQSLSVFVTVLLSLCWDLAVGVSQCQFALARCLATLPGVEVGTLCQPVRQQCVFTTDFTVGCSRVLPVKIPARGWHKMAGLSRCANRQSLAVTPTGANLSRRQKQR
jgi:hypothetical protein